MRPCRRSRVSRRRAGTCRPPGGRGLALRISWMTRGARLAQERDRGCVGALVGNQLAGERRGVADGRDESRMAITEPRFLACAALHREQRLGKLLRLRRRPARAAPGRLRQAAPARCHADSSVSTSARKSPFNRSRSPAIVYWATCVSTGSERDSSASEISSASAASAKTSAMTARFMANRFT